MSSVETKNEAGELLCVNQFSTFIMGAGGFGGKRSSPHTEVQQCMFNVLSVISGYMCCRRLAVFLDCVCPNMGAREKACYPAYSEKAAHRASWRVVPFAPSMAVYGKACSNHDVLLSWTASLL